MDTNSFQVCFLYLFVNNFSLKDFVFFFVFTKIKKIKKVCFNIAIDIHVNDFKWMFENRVIFHKKKKGFSGKYKTVFDIK